MHMCLPHYIAKAIVRVSIAMIINFGAVYEIGFPIDTDSKVTAISWKSELALPTRRFDEQSLMLLLCLHFNRTLLTA